MAIQYDWVLGINHVASYIWINGASTVRIIPIFIRKNLLKRKVSLTATWGSRGNHRRFLAKSSAVGRNLVTQSEHQTLCQWTFSLWSFDPLRHNDQPLDAYFSFSCLTPQISPLSIERIIRRCVSGRFGDIGGQPDHVISPGIMIKAHWACTEAIIPWAYKHEIQFIVLICHLCSYSLRSGHYPPIPRWGQYCRIWLFCGK